MGRKAEARAVLDEMIRSSKQTYISPVHVASIYLGLGEKDRAFEWLEKAYAQRSSSLALLKVNPRFDGVRSDPRFIDLMKRVNLESMKVRQ